MKKNFVLFGLFFCLSYQVFCQQISTVKLDSFFNSLSENNRAMGSFYVSKNGVKVYSKYIGFVSLDGKKISNETKFRIGSATKMFTATMIFQLIEEKKISLDSKLNSFFSQIPNATKITIETLLNHRSGLFDYVNDQKDTGWITRKQSTEIIFKQIENGKPHFLPDTKFSYCNSGYFLLTKIIEKITKETYNQNLQKRICSKINLQNTYSPSDNNLKNNEAESFSFIKSTWEKVVDIYFPNVVGVGDILSTPSDLAIFTETLMAGKLINKGSLSSMKTFKDISFGMGIMKVPFYEKKGFGHGGDTYGTHTIVANFPSDSLTISASINGDNFSLNNISIVMLSAYFKKDYEIPTFKSFQVSVDSLIKYVGVYTSNDIPLKITLTQKAGVLYAQATGQSTFPLEATEKDKFIFLQAGIKISFVPEKKEFLMEQSGRGYEYFIKL